MIASRDWHPPLDHTGLAEALRDQGIGRIRGGGLAQDVCVRATVLDACAAGFETRLIADTPAVDVRTGDGARAAMRAAGARIETTA